MTLPLGEALDATDLVRIGDAGMFVAAESPVEESGLPVYVLLRGGGKGDARPASQVSVEWTNSQSYIEWANEA